MLADCWLDHRFDLLGSGWVRVRHGMRCRGLEGHRYDSGPGVKADQEGRWLEGRTHRANLAESMRIWRLINEAYIPIDWQVDFKSGHRWAEGTWHGDVRFGHRPGVDVKVPWELARMQHLPQLAWAYALSADGAEGYRPPATYAREFRSQVLDFIATNQPRFGVNWRCTMDVAIRVANWLAAYDLFRAYGMQFDPQFEALFARSVYEHGCHIVSHLERISEIRGNHYLANIAGLLFVAAYLPCTLTTDAWLSFAVQELVSEVGFQFHPDGSNFESSTSYHGLSAEMVIYATALTLGLPREKQAALEAYDHRIVKGRPRLRPAPLPHYALSVTQRSTPFPRWYLDRLEKMAEFTMDITKPNGRIPQIGDNDSGRFLKLHPVYHRQSIGEAKAFYTNLADYHELRDEATHWDEDHLDHRGLVAAINGLFHRADMESFCGAGRIETILIRHLCGGVTLASYLPANRLPSARQTRVGRREDWPAIVSRIASNSRMQSYDYKIPLPGSDLLDGAACYGYPDFGLFVFRSPRLYLAIRCGPVGKMGHGGHAHNDQLSIELNVDGKDLIVDPGTYLYTADVRWRNTYRSVKAHFAPRPDGGKEPGRLELGLFQLVDEAKAECLFFAPYRFVGRHFGFGLPVYRVVELTPEAVHISDYADRRVRLKPLPPIRSLSAAESAVPVSLGYGVRVA